ncbi:hypothetical protein [Lacipirellula parvula]|uniref:Uncharacterized protein n=1 Tax=Lacipirellula parvula TaxID=2650471 RepID=A0A5K7XEF7_9BACT|nr:hypothetical protein [Lacipirellula parvula]BBO34447.1 hypothetical protein PLANPX_4059 [Lacipirellula parvula]
MNCHSVEYDQLLVTVLRQAYEDVSRNALLVGIEYAVLLDPRIRHVLEQTTYPDAQQINRVLVPLAFLLGRFETMTQFRFGIGPAEDRIPILATFHSDDNCGYFLALTYEEAHR